VAAVILVVCTTWKCLFKAFAKNYFVPLVNYLNRYIIITTITTTTTDTTTTIVTITLTTIIAAYLVRKSRTFPVSS
jgi:hypothetical protein